MSHTVSYGFLDLRHTDSLDTLLLSVLCATFEIGELVALVNVPTQKNIGPMVQLCLFMLT
jgi:hypothetical protein